MAFLMPPDKFCDAKSKLCNGCLLSPSRFGSVIIMHKAKHKKEESLHWRLIYYDLGCEIVYSDSRLPTFRRNILTPSSGFKRKPKQENKKAASLFGQPFDLEDGGSASRL
jgi:hypothetical protein